MNPFYIIQKGTSPAKYLTPQGGWSPNLAAAIQCTTREEAARKQAMHRARGAINQVHPQTCASCNTLFDPFYTHTCPLS